MPEEPRPFAMIPMQDLSEMLNPNSDKTMRLLDKHIPRSMLSLPISGEQLSNVLDELIREAKIRERDQVYFPLPDEHPLSQQSMFRNETKFTPEFQDIMTGEPMDIAWRLLKMPIIDTDIPGVRMGYNEKWIHPHNYPEPTIGTQPYFTDFDNEGMSGGEPSNKTHIGQMTPNEYFDVIQALAEKEGGVDRGLFTAPVIPGRDAEYR